MFCSGSAFGIHYTAGERAQCAEVQEQHTCSSDETLTPDPGIEL